MQDRAAAFVKRLAPSRAATIVALSGELGAGKTTFTQGAARALGIEETVSSPTFVIEKVYDLRNQPFRRLIHIDAYRLKDSHELEMLGWNEKIANPENLIFVEWPERVPELMPRDAIRIRFDIEGDARIITSNGPENSEEKSG